MRTVLLLLSLSFSLLALAGLPSSTRGDETSSAEAIRQALNKGELDVAEKLLDAAIKEFPDSQQLPTLHFALSAGMEQAGRMNDAARHAEALVDSRLQLLKTNPASARGLSFLIDRMVATMIKSGKPDAALQKLDGTIASLRAADATDPPSVAIAELIGELQNRKVTDLFDVGRKDEAAALMKSRHDAAKAAFEAKPDDATTVLALAQVLKSRHDYLAKAAPEKAAAADDEQFTFLKQQATKHGDKHPIVAAFFAASVMRISQAMEDDAARAETELKSLEEFVASLKSEDPLVRNFVATAPRSIAGLKRGIESAKQQQLLIGQAAFPLEVEAWVNGQPLTDADLKGKVVLIDFWAVWCGPCIATFPHLREWNDKFADKGLVIIGATRYYNYDWDDTAKRNNRVANLPPTQENTALEKFAAHHQLKHRFLVTPKDSQMQTKYGVTGIPHVVLIDREGKIRMMRVGSGDKNAHDLEAMIEKLLAVQ